MGRGLWPPTSPMGAHFFFNMHKKRILELCRTSNKVTNWLQMLDRGLDRVYNNINAGADATAGHNKSTVGMIGH